MKLKVVVSDECVSHHLRSKLFLLSHLPNECKFPYFNCLINEAYREVKKRNSEPIVFALLINHNPLKTHL
jgi:hypothetical protein